MRFLMTAIICIATVSTVVAQEEPRQKRCTTTHEYNFAIEKVLDGIKFNSPTERDRSRGNLLTLTKEEYELVDDVSQCPPNTEIWHPPSDW
jgi:hypothetical protein